MASPPKKHPWRENVEALLMAVVVAVTLKYFFLEISKIPSGSMQPTLMGSPELAVYDRVLVDKLSYQYRDPERFEVVVFKHPLERSRNMVKRIVGMPGEELRIEYGDVWTRRDGGPWSVLRRPDDVRASTWKSVDPDGWTPRGDPIRLGPSASVHYTTPGADTVLDGYLDGYPTSMRRELAGHRRLPSRNPVGDLRVEGEVEAEASSAALVVELAEGARTYRFVLPGPAAPPAAAPRIEPGETGFPGAPPAPVEASPWRLPAGDAVPFAVENVDDRLALEVDGERVAMLEVPAEPDPDSSIRLRVDGGPVLLHDLTAFRDVFYLPSRSGPRGATVPEGHYFMLGDNTQDSADSREWRAVRYAPRAPDAPGELRGNLRKWENPSRASLPSKGLTYFFRDEWGERHVFPAAGSEESDPEPAPLVPRDLIHGRVFCVFWPLKPWRGIWRLGWIR